MTHIGIFKGERVEFQQRTDGYFDIEITGIGKACERNITAYRNGTRTTRRMEFLAAQLNILSCELIRSVRGHGTVMHEMAAYDFVIGCSDEAYWFVAKTLHALRVDGVATVRDRPESPHDVVMGEMFGERDARPSEIRTPTPDDDEDSVNPERPGGPLNAIHAQGQMGAIRQIEDRTHDRPAFYRLEQLMLQLREEQRADHERQEHFIARTNEQVLAEQRTTNDWLAKLNASVEQIAADLYEKVWKGVNWLVLAMHRVRPTRQRPNTPTQQRRLDELHVDKLLKDLRDQDEIRG